jgi:hypothetical protein
MVCELLERESDGVDSMLFSSWNTRVVGCEHSLGVATQHGWASVTMMTTGKPNRWDLVCQLESGKNIGGT